MLRRKILTSAMASVMALTSISAVAFADETETAVKNVKTKADLEAYVKSFDSFRENEINDYGSIAGERFLAAIEYADNVLEDTGANIDDYTVAYKMMETCYNKLRIYTSSELRDLVNASVKTYETDNIMNEDLDDLIYTEESFSAFADAFEDAEAYISSNDPRLITDCYEALDEAKKNLNANTVVSKAMFRTALKNYETMISKLRSYDTWRKGELPGWVTLAHDNYWQTEDHRNVTYGELITLVRDGGYLQTVNLFDSPYTTFDQYFVYDPALNGASFNSWVDVETSSGVTGQLQKLVDDGVVSVGEQVKFVGTWGANDIANLETLPSTTATLQDWINEQYDALNEVKTASRTTKEEIVAAYNDCIDAVAMYNEWKADDTNRASKSSVQKLLTTYHSELVAAYATTAAVDTYKLVTGADSAPDGWEGDGTLGSANLVNDSGSKKSAPVGENGKVVDIAKNSDILKYVDVDSSMVTSNDTLAYALRIAEEYLSSEAIENLNVDGVNRPDNIEAGDVNTVFGLDQTGAVATAKRSTTEWTLVYRYLKYALEDAFPGADATYTKKQVSEMIDKAYDLADLTGDAAVFAALHNALVAARQDAVVWVREANKIKGYKDGDFVDGRTATDVYKSMESAYNALNDQLSNYAYGYEEIYNKISEVCDYIDSEKLVATDDLVAALNDTAYGLSILSEENVYNDENEAFSGDREFLGYNRLFTDSNNATQSEKDLKAAYEKLVAEVNKQLNPDAKLGDVNGDGVVNTLDAAAILKAIVDGTVDTLSNADFNADGAVNSLDAAAILKAVVDGTV